jgi:integral membrane sensor domain MASE1
VRKGLVLLLVFSIYVATGLFGLKFAPVSGFATLVWPPTGIAIAALWLTRSRVWPAIFQGAFTVNAVSGAGIPTALLIALGNTLEAVVAVALLRRWGFDPAFSRLRDVFSYLLSAGLLATTISATLGLLALHLEGAIPRQRAQATWLSWWLGDVMGALLIGTLVLTVSARVPGLGQLRVVLRRVRNPLFAAEVAALAVALVAPPLLVFGPLHRPLFGQDDFAIASRCPTWSFRRCSGARSGSASRAR